MHYEVLVIGAGPGGVETARILSQNKVKLVWLILVKLAGLVSIVVVFRQRLCCIRLRCFGTRVCMSLGSIWNAPQ